MSNSYHARPAKSPGTRYFRAERRYDVQFAHDEQSVRQRRAQLSLAEVNAEALAVDGCDAYRVPGTAYPAVLEDDWTKRERAWQREQDRIESEYMDDFLYDLREMHREEELREELARIRGGSANDEFMIDRRTECYA